MFTLPRRRTPTVLATMDSPSRLPIEYEHHSMAHVREVLHRYQTQSPAHFELAIEVQQIDDVHINKRKARAELASSNITISIQGNTVEGRLSTTLSCHVALRKRVSRPDLWECNVITPNRGAESLEKTLSSIISVIDAPLKQDTMWRWWHSNGRTFNWAALPTELKERIIEFCLHQPHDYGVYNERLERFRRRYRNDRKSKKSGPFEIVDQLGDWHELLYVSHQVRAITLRLCLTGSSSLTHSKGLCITASTSVSLSEKLGRLGDYYQMTETSSVPTTATGIALSKCYSRFPLIYSELHKYATFRHGIHKVSLALDFLSSMRFLRLQVGGFQRFPADMGPTYEVFERLPNLNEIVIRLPLRPRKGWTNNPYAGGPALFHHNSPCPRVLHRLIYERVAEVLAAYDKVTVRNFIDVDEERRFLSARAQAVQSLKITKLELQQLYADHTGGVALPEEVERRIKAVRKVKREVVEVECPAHAHEGFFPPSCHCDEPCMMSPALCAPDTHP